MAHEDDWWRKSLRSDGGSINSKMEKYRGGIAEASRLLATEEEAAPQSIGGLAKGAVGKVLSGLDYAGSVVRHGLREGAETLGLKENTVGLTAGEVLRSTDEADAAVQNMRATFGIDPNAGGRWAGALDTAGMILTDPTTYATFGAGAAAKTALGTVARTAGDDVAEAIAKGGVRSGDEVLATARAPRTVRDILEEAADTGLSRGSLDDVVSKQVKNLERRGRGGLGFAGFQTGIGARQGTEAAGRAREALLPVTKLFSPTAEVAAQLGRPAAEAVDVAAHTGGNVRREQRLLLADKINDPAALSLEVKEKARSAMVDDLSRLGGDRLVRTEAAPGWVALSEGQFVPKVVKDALDQSVRKPSESKVLSAIDKGLSAVKQHTTLGVANAVSHVPRNMVSNKLFAAIFGGVTDPRYYIESRNLRKALMSTSDEARATGGVLMAKELKDQGLDEVSVRRALATHDQQLTGRGGSAFDDVDIDGAVAQGKKTIFGQDKQSKDIFGTSREGQLGTRQAARLNSYDEELTRGAVFLKALDDGLEPALAARKSRQSMLDYSDEGLTEFERNVLQRVVFFYKFPRRSIPAGVEFMARYPGLADALGEAGIGTAQGARNEYEGKIGAYLDTPLEATVGGIADLLGDPLGAANPLIKTAVTGLSGNDIAAKDVLPPLGQLARLFDLENKDEGLLDREGGISPGAPGPYGLGALLGFREGKDYAKDRWTEDRDERVAERGEPSTTDKLIAAAEEAGVPSPYDMSDAQLVKALRAMGVPVQSIGALLSGG